MHFSKTYAQLLVTLSPDLRIEVFEYRKLKQLINQTVSELESLGIGPSVLRSLHTRQHPSDDGEGHDDTLALIPSTEGMSDALCQHTIVYEIALARNSSVLEPRLRLLSGHPLTEEHPTSGAQPIYHIDLTIPKQTLNRITRALSAHSLTISEDGMGLSTVSKPDNISGLIIPLPSDTAFFQLLTSTISSVSGHLDSLQDDFNSALASLAASVSEMVRPASSTAPRSFFAYSLAERNAMSTQPGLPGGNSDLYAWREIFRIYAEMEVFESVAESSRGDRSIEETEKRLGLFKDHISRESTSLVLPGSKDALEAFLDLNVFILEVKKFQFANSEATRKILKKHAKRTTFPIPSRLLEKDSSASAPRSCQVMLTTHPSTSLPRRLVQAIGEVLLPVVPHIDDYSCLICTSIAFRPIRLRCGHFFCVRCLAKMQKRSMKDCPMCRAPTVLRANPSNLDYGLLNFMADWFPVECREKLRANELEVAREQMQELGLDDVHLCRVM